MSSFRDIRVIPVVLVAIFGLAVLKFAGLIIDGGYVFDYQPNSTKRSWAQETFNFPGVSADIVTGSVQEKPKDEAAKAAVPAPEMAKPDGAIVYPDQSQPVSASERAILERLQSRRIARSDADTGWLWSGYTMAPSGFAISGAGTAALAASSLGFS